MSHTPHELAEEFPERGAEIAKLRARDAHFAKLVDDYHDVNRAIHRAETLVEPLSDEHEKELRKTRMALKDQIASALSATA